MTFTENRRTKLVSRKLVVAAVLATMGMTTAAQAGGLSMAAKVSTLGYGVELGYRLNNYLGVRAGVNTGSYEYSETDAGTDYDYSLDFDSIPLVLDWHVFGGAFRLTGGVVSNNNKLTGKATGALDIGTGTYTTSATSDISFDKTSMYVGLGWASLPSATRGFGLSFDIGVLGHGSPTATLTAPGVPPADIAAEEASLNADLEDFKYWPVLSLGVGYTF